jgi:hypothetical protein
MLVMAGGAGGRGRITRYAPPRRQRRDPGAKRRDEHERETGAEPGTEAGDVRPHDDKSGGQRVGTQAGAQWPGRPSDLYLPVFFRLATLPAFFPARAGFFFAAAFFDLTRSGSFRDPVARFHSSNVCSEISPLTSSSANFRRWALLLNGTAASPHQLIARSTSATIFASSVAVSSLSANEVGHMAPSSRFAVSLKPNVAYLELNFWALWKKQTTLPSLA